MNNHDFYLVCTNVLLLIEINFHCHYLICYTCASTAVLLVSNVVHLSHLLNNSQLSINTLTINIFVSSLHLMKLTTTNRGLKNLH